MERQDLIVVQLWLKLRVVHRMQPDDVSLDGLVEQSRRLGVKPIWKDGHESATKVERRERAGERLGRAEQHERVRADPQHLREQRKQRVEQPGRAQRAAERRQRALSADGGEREAE